MAKNRLRHLGEICDLNTGFKQNIYTHAIFHWFCIKLIGGIKSKWETFFMVYTLLDHINDTKNYRELCYGSCWNWACVMLSYQWRRRFSGFPQVYREHCGTLVILSSSLSFARWFVRSFVHSFKITVQSAVHAGIYYNQLATKVVFLKTAVGRIQ